MGAPGCGAKPLHRSMTFPASEINNGIRVRLVAKRVFKVAACDCSNRAGVQISFNILFPIRDGGHIRQAVTVLSQSGFEENQPRIRIRDIFSGAYRQHSRVQAAICGSGCTGPRSHRIRLAKACVGPRARGCSVEPDFGDRSMPGRQFIKMAHEAPVVIICFVQVAQGSLRRCPSLRGAAFRPAGSCKESRVGPPCADDRIRI